MSRSFNQRFKIDVDIEEAQKRFVNRIYNNLFRNLRNIPSDRDAIGAAKAIANKVGEELYGKRDIEQVAGRDFQTCLKAIEALYEFPAYVQQATIHIIVNDALALSECDLNISWRDGNFYPAGAELLDEVVVNEVLGWLGEDQYRSIYEPFAKALDDYSQSVAKPTKRKDVVTDMYEALEATAKIVVGNDKVLSANRQKFISELRLTKYHANMLKEYIDYANDFRHANDSRLEISGAEVENFIYLTGIFIRFALQKMDEDKSDGESVSE